jgi:hypothetical protein
MSTVRSANPVTPPNFKGKILCVEVSGTSTTYVLKNVSLEMQGDQLFLVGTYVRGASKNNWVEGVPIAICWSKINLYMIFDSVADYRRRQKKYLGGKEL